MARRFSVADSQAAAMRLVAGQVRAALRVREEVVPSSEGADFEVTIEHLQPWVVPEHLALQRQLNARRRMRANALTKVLRSVAHRSMRPL